jgi:branched-chain amino acid aminotransferase
MIALAYAHGKGFGEAIFANTKGELCEGATTNVFIVQDGEVLTPSTSSGCLPGITREIVLEILKLNEIPVKETDVPLHLLELASECFITSSTRGVQPIAKVNEHHIRKKSNSLTQQISSLYHKLLLENDDP